MKTLPQYPYLQNIVAEYHRQRGASNVFDANDYRKWLGQFGFRVPMDFHKIEFPHDFSDHDLLLFILRWA